MIKSGRDMSSKMSAGVGSWYDLDITNLSVVNSWSLRMKKQRVCVIGCGAAGLAAARHLSASPELFEVVVYEQTSQIGGTWVYTDKVGQDEYGLPIHTSMYKSLRTNLPKEIMGYPDFPIPDVPEDRSYLKASEILGFLNEYAKRFGILQHVKFLHHVKLVEPIGNGTQWKVTVNDLPKQEETSSVFDAVMICNGHYHTPIYAELKGIESFPGEQLHSHDYRDPEKFTGKRVVVVGAGPSGIDLSLEIASTASKVNISYY
ncbi:uncharacterized protein [Halyomorpha halys]|uniref:uncharacterized protein n=1 Tax=Halyomorpha halys TaxID=286706 RepID=UPI0034D30EA6